MLPSLKTLFPGLQITEESEYIGCPCCEYPDLVESKTVLLGNGWEIKLFYCVGDYEIWATDPLGGRHKETKTDKDSFLADIKEAVRWASQQPKKEELEEQQALVEEQRAKNQAIQNVKDIQARKEYLNKLFGEASLASGI